MSQYSTPPDKAPSEHEVREARESLPVIWIVVPVIILLVLGVGLALRLTL